MRFRNWLSWQVICLALLSMGLGAALGIMAVVWISMRDLNDLACDLYRKTTRVQLLEALVLQQTDHEIMALDSASQSPAAAPPDPAEVPAARAAEGGPLPPATDSWPARRPAGAAEAAPSAAASPAVTAPVVTIARLMPKGKSEPAPRKQAERAVEERAALAVAATPAPAAPAAQPFNANEPKVTGQEVISASRTARVEGVSADTAGVKGLAADVVNLRNGKTIRVGDRFPSGERLLMVDPDNGRVLTSQRQLLLFFPGSPGSTPSTATPQGALP